jgi:1-acyl-sn-glycerol-3-phosphate acyltransferase
MRLPLPLAWRRIEEEVDKRLALIPTRVNEYGFDPFGFEPRGARPYLVFGAFLYRSWFRVETEGIERVPTGRVLLIGNHAGNTIPFDGANLGLAMFLEANPPRIVRGMAEFYLPKIPWYSELIHRVGAVVGTPENCVQLLEREEAIAVFPEGHRGFIKPYSKAYQLQRFGTGFMRLALQTRTPVVPVGIVGSEEQSPGLHDSKTLGRLIGSPAFPITVGFPWLGLLGYLPLPVKYRIHFGEPILFDGDPQEEDALIEQKVGRVRDAISLLIEDGLAKRKNWFT